MSTCDIGRNARRFIFNKTTGFLYLILWSSFKLFEGMSVTGFVKYKKRLIKDFFGQGPLE